jgi:hypothetical protein
MQQWKWSARRPVRPGAAAAAAAITNKYQTANGEGSPLTAANLPTSNRTNLLSAVVFTVTVRWCCHVLLIAGLLGVGESVVVMQVLPGLRAGERCSQISQITSKRTADNGQAAVIYRL